MKLFFDTETTGQANFRLPVTAPCQPRMVSCAAILVSDDCVDELASIQLVVRPDGWTIPEDVVKIHGITTDIAMKIGVPAITVLSAFFNLAKNADELWAFNADYDRLVIGGELLRYKRPDIFTVKKTLCEMHAMVPMCKIEHTNDFRGDDEYKWPSLIEAHQTATGSAPLKSHDAMNDVRSLIAVHKWRISQAVPK